MLNHPLDLGAGGTCVVEPWHVYEHEIAIAYFRERELDHLDLARTRLQAMPDACVDSGGSVDELVQYSGANRFDLNLTHSTFPGSRWTHRPANSIVNNLTLRRMERLTQSPHLLRTILLWIFRLHYLPSEKLIDCQ